MNNDENFKLKVPQSTWLKGVLIVAVCLIILFALVRILSVREDSTSVVYTNNSSIAAKVIDEQTARSMQKISEAYDTKTSFHESYLYVEAPENWEELPASDGVGRLIRPPKGPMQCILQAGEFEEPFFIGSKQAMLDIYQEHYGKIGLLVTVVDYNYVPNNEELLLLKFTNSAGIETYLLRRSLKASNKHGVVECNLRGSFPSTNTEVALRVLNSMRLL